MNEQCNSCRKKKILYNLFNIGVYTQEIYSSDYTINRH